MIKWLYSYQPDKEKFLYLEENISDELNEHKVRIRPVRVGVCGSDTKQILEKVDQPKIGHEWVGIVLEIGSKVSQFSKGEKVISLAHTACESCKHCLAGSFKDCLSPQLLGEKSKSVLSSHIDLYECDLLKVPQELSFDDICLFEVAFIGDSAYERAHSIGLKESDECLVFGAGPIGIFTALALKHRGHKVSLVEKKKSRLETAKNIGLNCLSLAEVIIDSTYHNKFDAVFDCTGDNEGNGAIKMIPFYPKVKGKVVIVGKYQNAQLNELIYSGKALRVTWVSHHEKEVFENTIKFWSKLIPQYSDQLITLYDKSQIDQAFRDAIDRVHLKNMIKVNSHEDS